MTQLDHEVQLLIEEMKKTKEKRMYERYQALYLFKIGHSTNDIASIIGRSQKTVYNYIRAYQQGGIEGLIMGRSTGAPRRLTPIQETELVQMIVTKLPVDLGFSARHSWTLQLVAILIEREFGVAYTIRGVSKLLHGMGLSYTKPTYTLANADPLKQALFKEETFPALKKIINRRN